MYYDRPFPKAFECYKPTTEMVYGSICMSPKNKILLVRGRRSMKWSFPKGHKESRESYLECAVRETLEETGINLTNHTPVSFQRLSVGSYYFFELEEQLAEIKDTREVVEARWMNLNEIRDSPCNVDVNRFLSRMKNSRFFNL